VPLITCKGLKNLAFELFLALQILPVSRYLPSSDRRGTLLRDLARLIRSVDDTDDFDVKSVVPLLEQVVKHMRPMKIYGVQFSPSSQDEQHLQQSSTKPPSRRRSSPLRPHNKATNKFTTRLTHASSKRTMAGSTRIPEASTRSTLRGGLGQRWWKRLFVL
jgi:hypothetical protein